MVRVEHREPCRANDRGAEDLGRKLMRPASPVVLP